MSEVVKQKLAYSMREAVEATGYSRSYLYTQLSSGRLTAYRRGGRVFIKAENLQRMIDEDSQNIIEPDMHGCIS